MQIEMLTDHEWQFLVTRLERFANIDEVGMSDLLDEDVCDGDVEFRAYPADAQGGVGGEPVSVLFEVTVDEDADWHEELGVYSADNLRNGGPMYERLADELHDIVFDAYGTGAEFVKDKGSGAFTAEVEL